MKSNFIHVCFIIDCSGSMWASRQDVEGGFKSVIEEQKKNVENTGGSCAISLYTFGSHVHKIFMGKDIKNVRPFHFYEDGMTAMNDGIGTAIDEVGKWLNDMDESERPEKNLIVVITDGIENNSKEYSLEDVQSRIKHQTDKYSWEFVYLGTDITSADQGNDLGINTQVYTTRNKMGNSYNFINELTSCYLKTSGDITTKANALRSCAFGKSRSLNKEYLEDTGVDMNAQIITD